MFYSSVSKCIFWKKARELADNKTKSALKSDLRERCTGPDKDALYGDCRTKICASTTAFVTPNINHMKSSGNQKSCTIFLKTQSMQQKICWYLGAEMWIKLLQLIKI